MTLDTAARWRIFLCDAHSVCLVWLHRAEARVATLPRGTPERRKASREARERNAMRLVLDRAYRATWGRA
jgi:hypothetical protein